MIKYTFYHIRKNVLWAFLGVYLTMEYACIGYMTFTSGYWVSFFQGTIELNEGIVTGCLRLLAGFYVLLNVICLVVSVLSICELRKAGVVKVKHNRRYRGCIRILVMNVFQFFYPFVFITLIVESVKDGTTPKAELLAFVYHCFAPFVLSALNPIITLCFSVSMRRGVKACFLRHCPMPYKAWWNSVFNRSIECTPSFELAVNRSVVSSLNIVDSVTNSISTNS